MTPNGVLTGAIDQAVKSKRRQRKGSYSTGVGKCSQMSALNQPNILLLPTKQPKNLPLRHPSSQVIS